MKKLKPLTGAERVKRSEQRYRDAGLQRVRIWIHPADAEAVRNYAGNKHLTKSLLKRLKNANGI